MNSLVYPIDVQSIQYTDRLEHSIHRSVTRSHTSSPQPTSIMRFNIGPRSTATPDVVVASGTPNEHPPVASGSRRPPPSCPMHTSDSIPLPPAPAKSTAAKCPIDHEALKSDPNNPLNQIPASLSLQRQPNQTLELPTNRTTSTIPRPQTQEDDGKVWDYPSPQQFYNALVRKGWETPEDSVEMMVDIHNFLNEEAWQEVMKWERRRPGSVHPSTLLVCPALSLFPD